MKKNDLMLVIICVLVGGTISLVLSNIFINPSKEKVKVEVVEKINSEFPQPDTRYFNDESINPTQPIQIGSDKPNEVQFDR